MKIPQKLKIKQKKKKEDEINFPLFKESFRYSEDFPYTENYSGKISFTIEEFNVVFMNFTENPHIILLKFSESQSKTQ